ncbi:nucleotidyltransferase family protein [Enterovibrio sp. ZSDZ42]|uniref:Nucleotidyltransferase family protein n=1 Tax=Enterovibrio gelatinilyticus TaxID=2899819 RepID=A0ABT5QVT9_9GAMM|nr:nucleotidyltransferase family protein [Enterovibrio sp. ZSDZ42]MDD1792143.1 nucleotidyltransferase family protein [Enterovibrio sp. ZSDZ42]
MKKIAAVILAAGKASRFGSCKALALINDRPLIESSITAANAVTPDVYIATGYWHKALSQAAADNQWNAKLLYIDNWQQGIGDVISHVTHTLCDDYDGLLFLLADQPAITGDNVALLCQVYERHQSDAACCQYPDTIGVPAIINARVFDELKALKGDEGAKKLLMDRAHLIDKLALDQCNIDIDTPEDLANYVHYLTHMSSLW